MHRGNGTRIIQISPSAGSQKVCIVGLAHSSSKFRAWNLHPTGTFLSSSEFHPWVGHKRYTPLGRHLPHLTCCPCVAYKKVCAIGSKAYPRVAHKRSAPLDWHLPSSKFHSRVAQKVCIVGLAHSSSKFYPRVAHKRYAPWEWHPPHPNFTFGWVTNCMHRWIGPFLL